jgi:uncharacterized membrane protein
MNSVQMHLALTHVPVILSLAGLIMLAIAFLVKNPTLTKTSYILILIAGVAALPVFLTGEATEETIENLPGVSEGIIEKHEEVAKWAMISIAVAGLLAVAALFLFKRLLAALVLKIMVLLVALTSGGLMAQTAHLGGQIRHTEIRNGVALLNGNESGGNNGEMQNTNPQKEQDDD